MWNKILTTRHDWVLTLARFALGLVILPHGAQKLLGWFGGAGPGATIGFFAEALGMPAVLTVAVIAVEFFGGLALILGVVSRLAAAGVASIMVVAVLTVHWQNGFFMNWFGNQPGEGFEFHILALALSIAILLKGAGAASLDRALAPSRA